MFNNNLLNILTCTCKNKYRHIVMKPYYYLPLNKFLCYVANSRAKVNVCFNFAIFNPFFFMSNDENGFISMSRGINSYAKRQSAN